MDPMTVDSPVDTSEVAVTKDLADGGGDKGASRDFSCTCNESRWEPMRCSLTESKSSAKLSVFKENLIGGSAGAMNVACEVVSTGDSVSEDSSSGRGARRRQVSPCFGGKVGAFASLSSESVLSTLRGTSARDGERCTSPPLCEYTRLSTGG